MSNRAINWLITPPRSLGINAKEALLSLIKSAFQEGQRLLTENEADASNDEEKSSDFLMDINGFKLELCSSLKENTLDPSSCEGAGEFSHLDGHYPLLIFIYLEKRFREEWKDQDENVVSLCDEQGNIIYYRDFNSLEPVIADMGFDYDEVRNDAAKLGLTTTLVNFSEVTSEIDDCFF
ncbi:hypothetical protein [Marinomonas algarum]|uniref:Uncharacterized protein n=1 Tax=Marinomonas algarum TaxID=2883105 RepID=A0A9X1RUW4_9GAMM|nr:hypothetical protein [Marinomonas algarum]MCB5162954.1 hypothetical protein [Marinomonas algarum]